MDFHFFILMWFKGEFPLRFTTGFKLGLLSGFFHDFCQDWYFYLDELFLSFQLQIYILFLHLIYLLINLLFLQIISRLSQSKSSQILLFYSFYPFSLCILTPWFPKTQAFQLYFHLSSSFRTCFYDCETTINFKYLLLHPYSFPTWVPI